LYKITFGIMAESSVGQRFSQLIQQLGMSKNAFAMSLDKTATVIQHLVDERNKPGFDLMCKVFEVYPNVSKDWLLLGSGPMMLPAASPLASAADDPSPDVPVAAAKPMVAPAVSAPSFPEPLFPVSAARLPVIEVPTLPAAPAAASEIAAAAVVAPQPVPALGGPIPVIQPSTPQPPVPNPSPVVPTAPAATPDASALTAALHAQYLQHQLALAEQRNQHLLEQQALMQQMLDLMRRTI
jgi:hypothetical protein